MKKIKLNDKVSLDLDKLIAGKLLLQAGSGGGKSYAIRRLLEQSFGTVPHLILDTEGEFSSLRDKYDYILIGKGLDINADPKTAALLAQRLWKERVSAIIDLYELSPWDRQLFVKNFVDAMVNAPKELWKPVLLVIDEAHEYAPESDKSDSGRALHLLASKGRKRQIGAIFATQRISSLSKNIVASCKNKLIGYASETNDVKRAAFELGFTPAEARSLRDLDPGEFYAFGPALTKEVTKIKIGKVSTRHEISSAATAHRFKVAPASPALKKTLAGLADLPQVAAEEAKTVSELKAALAASQRALGTEKQRKVDLGKTIVDLDYTTKAVAHAVKETERAGKVALETANKEIARLSRIVSTVARTVGSEVNIGAAPLKVEIERPKIVKSEPIPRRPSTDEHIEIVGVDMGVMGKGEREILKAIAGDAEGITTEHIAVLTGYKTTSRREYLRKLMARGLIERDGETFIANQQGIQALGSDYEPLPTGAALRGHVQSTLSGGEKKLFDAIIGEYPQAVSREWLEHETNYQTTSVREYARKLVARKLIKITGAGEYTASEKLF